MRDHHSARTLVGRCAVTLLLSVLVTAFPGGCDNQLAANGKIRLELWTLALRPKFDDYMSNLVNAFEKENPTIDVVWVDVPFDAIQRKFLASAAAGRAPDVINLSDGFYARFVALGGVVDLSTLLPGDPDKTYFRGALSLCKIDGKLYALPWYLAANIGFLNTKLLNDAGIDPQALPNDWPGLRRAAIDYHAKTGKFLMAPQLGQESQLPLWFYAENLSPLRARSDGRGMESNLDDPRIVQLIRDWVETYRIGALPAESVVGDHGRMIDLYQNGKTAFMVAGPNFLERIRDAAPEVFQNTINRPSPIGADGRHEISTMLLCVTSQSKHPSEAAKLAWFMTNARNQLAFAKIVSILPSTPASMDDPHFQQTATKTDRARNISAESMKNATSYVPPLAAWPELTAVFQEQIKAALLDGADVEKTLNEIGTSWNGILNDTSPSPGTSSPSPGTSGEGRAEGYSATTTSTTSQKPARVQ